MPNTTRNGTTGGGGGVARVTPNVDFELVKNEQ